MDSSFNSYANMAKRLFGSLLLVVCLTFGLAVQALSKDVGGTRILGGEDAGAGDYPWVVSVRRNNAHKCMGSIISETKVLTAGSCVSNVGTTPVATSEITLRVGSINQFAGGSIVSIKEIIIHPSYGNFMHNIAILTLSTSLTFGDKINKIDLPIVDEENVGELDDNTPVYVQGWGELITGGSSFKLQTGAFNTLASHLCELEAGYGYSTVICLKCADKGAVCRGDEGAGVISDDKKLVGVVSFFFGNCGTKYPDISTKVSSYLEWINTNLEN